ncbi:lipocalin family protein [Aeromonas sobria]|uniref:lipocalin family protein n=1 Tax=Aeromonas sobria TaxID=646 RepID=UPI003D086B8B
MRTPILLVLALLATACTGLADGIRPVTGFQLDRYLGTWYEIARLDHSFERGLERVSASYSLRDDGGVRVINRGQDEQGVWREAEGKAYFVGKPDEGRLKVSFFGPFYGGYNVIDLDPDYQLSLVTSYSHDYLWILARSPQPPREKVDALIAKARELGFATDQLIWVRQAP